jgi:hypothetical protein
MTDFWITKSTIISYSVKERRLHFLSLKSLLNTMYEFVTFNINIFLQELWVSHFNRIPETYHFLRVLWFSPSIKLPRYNWNIVESGVKHHKPKKPKTEYEWNRQCDDMFLPPTKLSMSGIDSVMTYYLTFSKLSYLSLCCAYVFFYLYFGSNFVVTVMMLNATFNTISVIS